jgi:signal transduction histidine kinase
VFDDDDSIAGVLVVCLETTARMLADRERVLLTAQLHEERTRAAAMQSSERLARVQELTAALARAHTLDDVANVVVVDMVRALGARTGAIAGRAPDGEDALVLLRQVGFPDSVLGDVRRQTMSMRSPLVESFHAKAPVWIESRKGPNGLDVRYPPIAPVWDVLGVHSATFIPLVVADQPVGVISFAFEHARTFSPEERAVLLALGQQAAVAVERARLFEAEHAARATAEASERRAAFLAELGAALQPLVDPDALMATTAQLLGEHLGVDRCAYAEVAADQDAFVITGDYTRGDTISIVGQFTFRDFGAEVLRLMRANEDYVVDDVEADPRVTPEDRKAYEVTQIQAVICVPLHKAGRFVAAMAVHQREPRHWTADEIDLVVTVVRRCWESLERARAYRNLREREEALRATTAQLVERTAAAEAAQQAAEEANRSKSEFLAIMSHELRTPLNAIGGYAEMLELGVRGPITSEQRADLVRIQRSQRTLLGLINGVLNYARLDAGAVDYVVEDVAMDEVLAACEALVLPQVRSKGLQFEKRCAPVVPVARADREKTEQVIRNLLSNAIKFTEPGGRIEVDCYLDRDEHVAVRVSDTGRGIAPEQIERVFQPFVQVDAQLTRKGEGTGLGLAISRDLARGMGGDLTVTSTPAEGSTFTFTLPGA